MPTYKVEVGTVQIDCQGITTPGTFESDDPSLQALVAAGIISEVGKAPANTSESNGQPALDVSRFENLSRDEVFRLLELKGVLANPKTPLGTLRKMLAKAEAAETEE